MIARGRAVLGLGSDGRVNPFASYRGMVVRVELFGGLVVRCGEDEIELPGAWSARSLFAWLALHPGRHPRRKVAAVFWPEVPDESARASLRTALWALRRALGECAGAAFIADREHLGLAGPPEVLTDLGEFEQLLVRGEPAAALSRCGEGELLAGLDDDWVLVARDEHSHRIAGLLGELAEREEAAGNAEAALSYSRRRFELDPLEESAARDLLARLARGGDRVGAVRVFERLRSGLRDDLGLTPARETTELYAELVLHSEDEIGQARERKRPDVAATPASASRGGWQPDRDYPRPPALASIAQEPFAGREPELAELGRHWAEAREHSVVRTVLVSGEAGAGKTRLAAEIATRVADPGAVVLYGAALHELLVPYRPIASALATLAAGAERDTWERLSAPRASELAAVLDPSIDLDAEGLSAFDLSRSFRALSELLAELAGPGGLLLVLDDLQWSDFATAGLIRQLLAEPPAVGMLVVLAYRPHDPGRTEAIDELVGECRRQPNSARIELGGLDARAIAMLSQRVLGDDSGAEELARLTAGNALFVRELLRDRAGEPGREGRVPAGVAEIVAGRLTRLDRDTRAVLALGAVAGPSFEIEVLERIGGLRGPELDAAIAAALAAGLIVELDDPGGYRFVHEIVRQALVARHGRAGQARIHARVGRALEELWPQRRDELVPRLAHHWSAAGRFGDIDRAVEYAERAADAARVRLAFDDAVDTYNRALALLAEDDPRHRRLLERRAVAYLAHTHSVVDRL